MNLRPSGYEPDELPDCSTPRRMSPDYTYAVGLVVGVVVALGVAWIAVAVPVVLLLGLAAGLVAVRRRLWPRGPGNPTD